MTQLTTVKLGFDQIRTMICVFSGFRCSLLFLALFAGSQTFAKPGNNANRTPVSTTDTKQCNNVYYNLYFLFGILPFFNCKSYDVITDLICIIEKCQYLWNEKRYFEKKNAILLYSERPFK